MVVIYIYCVFVTSVSTCTCMENHFGECKTIIQCVFIPKRQLKITEIILHVSSISVEKKLKAAQELSENFEVRTYVYILFSLRKASHRYIMLLNVVLYF